MRYKRRLESIGDASLWNYCIVRTFWSTRWNDDLFFFVFIAALFFRNNDAVRMEASLLLGLSLNEEVLVQRKSTRPGHTFGAFSIPTLVSNTQQIPFVHDQHSWTTDKPFLPLMQTLRHMEATPRLPLTPVEFLGRVWAVLCSGEDLPPEDLDLAAAFSSRFGPTQREAAALRARCASPCAEELLLRAQNATTHRAAKRCASGLKALLTAVGDDEERVRRVLARPGWTEAFARFLLTPPANAMDRQVLFHLLSLVEDALGSVCIGEAGEGKFVNLLIGFCVGLEVKRRDRAPFNLHRWNFKNIGSLVSGPLLPSLEWEVRYADLEEERNELRRKEPLVNHTKPLYRRV